MSANLDFIDAIGNDSSDYTKVGNYKYLPVVKGVLYSFGAQIVKGLQLELLSKKHNSTGNLSKSIEFDVIEIKSGNWLFELRLADYYKYINEGVKGKNFTHTESVNSPYKYNLKYPPASAIGEWVGKKGIDFYETKVSKKGKSFQSLKKRTGSEILGTIRTMQAIIFNRGVKATHFYNAVVNDETLDELRLALKKALKRDVLIKLSKEN